jgi:chaperonin GroEL
LILLYDRPITQMKQFADILSQVNKSGKSLLIIAEDVDAEALAFLLVNNANRNISVCAIKSPYEGGEKREQAMEDIAILTGATYFSNLTGNKLEKATMKDLGSAKKVIVTKNETTIIDGAYDEEKRQERLLKLTEAKANAETDEEREAIELRIARLKGAVAIIEVGGATETEMLEKKDRIDDAIRSVKAALTEGFVPGGGTAFLRASANLTVDASKPVDFQRGEQIVLQALESPLYNICVNAGVSKPSDIVLQVLGAGEHFGYNAQKEEVENLVDSGIIDATKVLNAALINGASVAGSILTTESLICDTY